MNTQLEAHDLVIEAQARRILDRVNLQAGRGEFIGLVGPNGAGKTTLLKAILGLVSPREGVVFLDGRSLARLPPREVARHIGYVPQALPETPAFTTLEVVLMGRYPHLGPFQVEGEGDRRIALEALRTTETHHLALRPVATLSGGERQRVFLARALAQQAPLLLLDEPIAHLDIQHQIKVMEMVRDLTSRGVTAIAALHDLELAGLYCHRLVLLHQGRVVAEGPPDAVLTPANLEEVFGVSALIYRDPATGRLVVTPSHTPPKTSQRLRVHLVCGGGSGAHLLYLLHRGGFAVTACPLGQGDTDRLTASALGIPFIPLPAFAPVDDDAHQRHRQLVAQADVAVLCDVPFGPNNLPNLEALRDARRLLSLEKTPFAQRDYTGGVATRIFQALTPCVRCGTPEEVFSLLLQWEQQRACVLAVR
ncbi:Fe(3+) dicitrate transport ATP-binding protein FecE [bacterium HR23]|nr:Fe(3+) dicitrate transport ATP-binding protein FecE [bacterium HR23]